MSYHNLQIQVRADSPLFQWCDDVTKAANNLYNAAMFVERQLRSGLNKEPAARFENEIEVIQKIENALPLMNKGKKKKPFVMPTAENPYVWYEFLDAFFKVTKNPDYTCPSFSRHAAQHVLKNVCQNMKSFFAARRAFYQDSTNFTGEPKFPNYHKKGGNTTAIISNQDCRIFQDEKGSYWAKLPKTKTRCCLGKSVKGKLKEVHICPFHGIFILNFVLETKEKTPTVSEVSSRVCAIDFGVNNLAAITNNIGKPFLLFKGGVIKSINQWYNKKMAAIMSEQTKGTTNKFVPTPESQKLCIRREAQINDFMHKTAKRIIEWCDVNKIDTIVMGINKGWKQESNLGKKNNQNFVQIPFYKLQSMLRYLAAQRGILVVEQEESYTSKASFLDLDDIPEYQKGNKTEYQFSGCRKTRGNYVRKGHKGSINADLNGSANIGRKAFPHLFTPETCNGFSNVEIYKHPDLELISRKLK